jgi:hypothetical protein
MSTIPTPPQMFTIDVGGQCHLDKFQNYLFITNSNTGKFYRTSVTNPSSSLVNLFTAGDASSGFPSGVPLNGIANDGTYLYMCSSSGGGIKRYDINGNRDNSWSSNFSGAAWGLIYYQNYLYASHFSNGDIAQISTINPTDFRTNWISLGGGGSSNPQGMCIVGNNMYVAGCTGAGAVYKIPINFSNNPPLAGTKTDLSISISLSGKYPWGIVSYNNKLFISLQNAHDILYCDLNGTEIQTLDIPTSVGNFCTGLIVININNGFFDNKYYLYNIDTNIYRYLIDNIILTPSFSGQITCSNIKYFH